MESLVKCKMYPKSTPDKSNMFGKWGSPCWKNTNRHFGGLLKKAELTQRIRIIMGQIAPPETDRTFFFFSLHVTNRATHVRGCPIFDNHSHVIGAALFLTHSHVCSATVRSRKRPPTLRRLRLPPPRGLRPVAAAVAPRHPAARSRPQGRPHGGVQPQGPPLKAQE